MLLALRSHFTRSRWVDVLSRAVVILAETFEVVPAYRPPISLGDTLVAIFRQNTTHACTH